MGKKSKKNKETPAKGPAGNTEVSKSGEDARQEAMTRQTKRETLELVNQLLESKSWIRRYLRHVYKNLQKRLKYCMTPLKMSDYLYRFRVQLPSWHRKSRMEGFYGNL